MIDLLLQDVMEGWMLGKATRMKAPTNAQQLKGKDYVTL